MDSEKIKIVNISFVFLLVNSFVHIVLTISDVSEAPTRSTTVFQPTTIINNTADGNNQTTIPTTTTSDGKTSGPVIDRTYLLNCPYDAACSVLGAECINCKLNYYCVYGAELMAECTPKPNITCTGEQTFKRKYHCRYGYQLDTSLYYCDRASVSCTMKEAPTETYFANCKVRDDVLCLGSREFQKKFPCNLTKGYKWSTALVLSVTLGGFGVDRFYLGLWREGIGKLFSFGGLGVWTLVDVILIAIGYVGPHDGSLYIYPWS